MIYFICLEMPAGVNSVTVQQALPSKRRNLGLTKSEAACMAACIGVGTLVFVIDQQQQGNKDKTKHKKKTVDFGGDLTQ